jgi:diguanylate cyclase (GGDEF)-like protein/PAS domain S-box-containing protein
MDCKIENIIEALDLILNDDLNAPDIEFPTECEALDELSKTIKAVKESVFHLSEGDLSYEIKGRGVTIGALKKLQSSLRHLTWQTKAIAEGDFNQRVDFLGEYSDAFNKMTEELESKRSETLKLKKEAIEAKEHFETIFKMIPDPTLITTLDDFRIMDFNQAFTEASGYGRDDLKLDDDNARYLFNNDPDMRRFVKRQLDQEGYCRNVEGKFISKKGNVVDGLVSSNLYYALGVPYVIHVVRDITEKVLTEKQLKESESRLNLIIEKSPIGIFSYSLDGVVIKANTRFAEIIGAPKKAILGFDVFKINNEKMREAISRTLSGESANYEDYYTSTLSGKSVFVRASYVPLVNEEGNLVGGLGIVEDFSDRKRLEEEILKLSVTDKLTQIYNRMKLDEVLDQEVIRAKRTNQTFCAILMDIDHFKSVNDNFGHQVGDVVLIEVASLLKTEVRAADVVGRWGGEEFLIIASQSNREGGVKLAEKLRILIENHEFSCPHKITCSFGVATYQKGCTPSTLVSRADEALYIAKRNGRNRVIYR